MIVIIILIIYIMIVHDYKYMRQQIMNTLKKTAFTSTDVELTAQLTNSTDVELTVFMWKGQQCWIILTASRQISQYNKNK